MIAIMINAVLTVMSLLLLSTQLSSADTLSYQYKSFLKLEHDNNKLMRNSDTEATEGASLSNSIELFKTNARAESYLRAVMLISEYTGEDEKIHSDEDYTIFYGTNYSWPRLSVAVQGDHRRESTYINEIEDSGIVENSKFRITNKFATAATYVTSPRSTVTVDASITDLAFPDTVPVSLSEYTYINKSITGAYRLSKKSQVVLSLFETNYDAHTSATKTDTTGFNATLSYTFDPLWSGMFTYGQRYTDFSPACASDECDDQGEVINFNIEREGQKTDTNLKYSKTLTPNSSGNLNETQQMVASYRLSLTPRLSAELKYKDYENEALSKLSASRDKSYQAGFINIYYALDRQWYLTSRFTHKKQKYSDALDSGSADSNSLYFILGYNGHKTGFSL